MRIEVDVDSIDELVVSLRKMVAAFDDLEAAGFQLPPAEAKLRRSIVAALEEWERSE